MGVTRGGGLRCLLGGLLRGLPGDLALEIVHLVQGLSISV